MPRCGRSQERSKDQKPSMVFTCTSWKPSPSSSRAFCQPGSILSAGLSYNRLGRKGPYQPSCLIRRPSWDLALGIRQRVGLPSTSYLSGSTGLVCTLLSLRTRKSPPASIAFRCSAVSCAPTALIIPSSCVTSPPTSRTAAFAVAKSGP